MRTSSISRPSDVGVRPHLVAHFAHHRGALFRQRRLEAAQAVDPAQRRIETRAQPLLRPVRRCPDTACAEHARIGDAVGEEGVDLVELAARNLHADVVEVEAQQAVFDDLHVVGLEEARTAP